MIQYKVDTPQIGLKYTKGGFPAIKIQMSRDAADFIRQFYSDDIHLYESFFLLLLNKANNTIGYAKISQGGVCGTVVDTIIIAKYAIDALASTVVLAHNHPSGNLKPSQADIDMTKKVKEALKLFNVAVLDHIILAPENGYYSFADDGML